MSRRHFLSFARMGASASILRPAPPQGQRPELPEIKPRIFLSRDGGDPVAMDGPAIRVMDPSDVVSIAESIITRRYPAQGSTTTPPNEFAYVEFGRPDLPWMFTPAAASDGRLRPWIVLVVVPASVHLVDARPLSRLKIAMSELPDLSDSWAWAHAQVIVDNPANVEAAIERGGAGAVSRLICPRKLDDLTWYRACLVPAFKPDLTPSWTIGAGAPDADVEVYATWHFRTGPKEDFEDLVRRLKPAEAEILERLGTRSVDASKPWPAGKRLRELANQSNIDDIVTFEQDGAFAVRGQESRPSMDDSCRAALTSQLATQLNYDAAGDDDAPPDDAPPVTEHLTPPIYGRYYPGIRSVDPSSSRWTDDLNLDPSRRAAASMGTRYVQKHQEFLMARAWDQLQDLEKANTLRRIAEFASVTGDALHRRHVTALTSAEMLAVASPARTRVTFAEEQTVQAAVTASPLPDAAATPAFTRLTRSKGPLARRLSAAPPSAMVEQTLVGNLRPRLETTSAPILSLAQPLARVSVDVTARRGAAHRDRLLENERQTLVGALATVQVTVAAAEASGAFPEKLEPARATLRSTLSEWETAEPQVDELQTFFADSRAIKAAADAAMVVGRYVTEREPMGAVRPQAQGVGIELATLRETVGEGLLPSLSLRLRLADRISIPFTTRDDPFAQVMAHPRFPAPLALAVLRDWPDVILPGLGTFPMNKVTLLQTNPGFIEAFLVGVNHEMNREFLWREFPTDQRASPFLHFWPRQNTDRDDGREIEPIVTWRLDRRLGKHLAGDRAEETVLLVRGEVLRRFPNTVVMAAPAQDGRTAGHLSQWRLPAFTVPLGSDAVAYVFNLRASGHGFDPARWFFVFQEPVTAPRFGLDVSRPAGDPINSWNDVSWEDVPARQRPPFLQTGDTLPTPSNPSPAHWDRNRMTSADVAEITVQRPFRILFHGRALLG